MWVCLSYIESQSVGYYHRGLRGTLAGVETRVISWKCQNVSVFIWGPYKYCLGSLFLSRVHLASSWVFSRPGVDGEEKARSRAHSDKEYT